jgi:ABC-2 type transport system ATP-binding protein
VITFETASARAAPGFVEGVSVTWAAGVHAIVGATADGGPLVLAIAAGVVPLRAGQVRVLGGAPNDAGVRECVAFVPREPPLPGAMRVDELLATASVVRGDAAPEPLDRLRALGLETLGPRRVRALSREECRAVAVAEAVTSPRVRVVLLEEPFLELDPRAAAKLAVVLRDRAAAGCAIVLATASVRDACSLADDQVTLHRGAVVGQGRSVDLFGGFTPAGARLRIVTSDARALVVALARERDVNAVAHRDGAVVARGADSLAVAQAAGRAIVESGVDVVEMRFEPPTIEELRAASAGIAKATYDAAYARTRTGLEAQPAPPCEGAPP